MTINLQCNSGSETEAFDLETIGESPYKILKATTKEVEHKLFQPNRTHIYVAFSEDLEKDQKLLKLKTGHRFLHYRFVITVDSDKYVALEELKSGKYI